jgi:hypothetical protein
MATYNIMQQKKEFKKREKTEQLQEFVKIYLANLVLCQFVKRYAK